MYVFRPPVIALVSLSLFHIRATVKVQMSWVTERLSPVVDLRREVAGIIHEEIERLHHHLRLGEPADGANQDPLFFVELAPNSCRVASCQLPTCEDDIAPGDYRMALYPPMNNSIWVRAFAQRPGNSPFLVAPSELTMRRLLSCSVL